MKRQSHRAQAPRLPLTNRCVVLESFSYSRSISPLIPPLLLWPGHTQTPLSATCSHRSSFLQPPFAYRSVCSALSHPIPCRPNPLSGLVVVFGLTAD